MTNYFSGNKIAQDSEQGPLDGIIPTYADFLSQQGFSKISACQQLRFLADMNRWLHQKRLSITDLTAHTIQRYLRLRHRRLRPRRDDAAILNRLVHLLHTQGLLPKKDTRQRACVITTELALRWAQLPQGVQPAHWAARLNYVRSFARYLSATDPRTQIPPMGLLPFRYKRATPYIYSDKQIEQILKAAIFF